MCEVRDDDDDEEAGKAEALLHQFNVWPKGAGNGYNDIATTTTTVYKLYKDYLQNPKRDIICDGGNYAMESSLTFLTYKGSVPYPKQKKKKVLMYSDVGFIYAGHFFTEPDYNRLQLLQGERPSMVEEGQWIYHTPT
ncbi:F-box family protein [Prunus dulcis]|uniref:F-box family protein n=1 Tax=Prunus dulcis TaxID=3755 RepID=A0A4Y1RG56_PRUDU|nr:F-box family protein [Prunus dulcis]